MHELLQERFPEIAFLLTVEEGSSYAIFDIGGVYQNAIGPYGAFYQEDIKKELLSLQDRVDLEQLTILYVYGLGLGTYYHALRSWLHARQERVLLFIEEDLSVLRTFLQSAHAQEILSDRQVHLVYLPKSMSLSCFLDNSVKQWISDRVEWIALDSYAKSMSRKMRNARSMLLQKTSRIHVGMTELVQYPLLLKNLIANSRHLVHACHVNRWQGAFQGVPAILCGAGTSLESCLEYLPQVEHKALIVAGGSAITILGRHGIMPHIALALDPNEEEYERIRDSHLFEVPFLYSLRLHAEILSSCHVQSGYLYSETGGIFEAWLHDKLAIGHGSLGPELGIDAFSVTTLAVPLLRFLGCDPVLFCGIDLSYQNKKRYATGVLQDVACQDPSDMRAMERLRHAKNTEGQSIYTLTKWLMEAECIGSYVQAHPSMRCFRASTIGLPIKGVSHCALEDFVQRYCLDDIDLRARVHGVMETTRFPKEIQGALEQLLKTFYESLQRCLTLCNEVLSVIEKEGSESVLIHLLSLDIEEEDAYKYALAYPFQSLRLLIERQHSVSSEKALLLWQARKKSIEIALSHFV